MFRFIGILLLLPIALFGQEPTLVLELPWGQGPAAVGIRIAPEANYGPQAFQVQGDTIWILDSQNNAIKQFVAGTYQIAYPIAPLTEDFYFSTPDFYITLTNTTLLVFRNTKLVKQYSVGTPKNPVDFIRSISKHNLLITLSDGKQQKLSLFPGKQPDEIHFQAPGTREKSQVLRISSSEGIVRWNGARAHLQFPKQNLASLRLLYVDTTGNAFVLVESIVQQVPLQVKREIRVLNPQGQVLAVLNLPVTNYTYIFRDVYITPEGVVYHMVTSPQGMQVFRWNLPAVFNSQTPPNLQYPEGALHESMHYNELIPPPEPESDVPQNRVQDFPDYPQVLPEDALQVADDYVQLDWTATHENLTNGVVTDPYGYLVQTPGWVTTGSNRHVPYKWGGFETIEQFLYGIHTQKYAGDIYTNKSSGTPSAVGVDCSGFVSRCWNLPMHYSTRMMDDALTKAYAEWSDLEPGDAIHKPGHVRLVVEQHTNGSILVAESSGRDWRVSYRNYYYSDLVNYTPRYYIKRQGAPGLIPQPRLNGVLLKGSGMLYWAMAGQENTDSVFIETSTDGTHWRLLATVPDTITQYPVDVAADSAWYFRLYSTAGGKKSEYSDVYGFYANSDSVPPVLIVDGFDRTSATYGYWSYCHHSFVVRIGQALAHWGIPFETVDNNALLSGMVNIQDYPAVFWLLGDESTHDETFNQREQELVQLYLQHGGKLFVSGAEIAWDLDHRGTDYDRQFLHDFLKAQYESDDANVYQASGRSGTPFEGLTIHFDNGTHGTYNVNYPDVLEPLQGALPALGYSNGGVAGVYYEGVFPGGNTRGKLVYLGFPYETIYRESERLALMQRVLEFFNLKAVTAVTSVVDVPVSEFQLYGNYPNPFNGVTHLRFYVPSPGIVEVQVFNILGQRVYETKKVFETAGRHQLILNASRWATGIYMYRIQFRLGKNTWVRRGRMLLVR